MMRASEKTRGPEEAPTGRGGSLRDLYYLMRPLIPRPLQVGLRRILASRKRSQVKDLWPVDPRSGEKPPFWKGWPEGREFALVLTHDVDTTRGQGRCRFVAQLEEERGLRSSFNYVPERYPVSSSLREELVRTGFEVGVHGLVHDGKLYRSREIFTQRARRINRYLKEWGSVGFRSPAMHHQFDWIGDLCIEYDASSFDTDPFEPQSDGVGTIFPFVVKTHTRSYVELPYTLPQDFTLFILLRERDIRIWKEKLAWIARHGGMALVNVHPDYMAFEGEAAKVDEYPVRHYVEFLDHILSVYGGRFWHALPKDVARFVMGLTGEAGNPLRPRPCGLPIAGL